MTPFFTDKAREAFSKVSKIGEDPLLDARDPDIPVGLKVCLFIPRVTSFLKCHECHRILVQHAMPMLIFKLVFYYVSSMYSFKYPLGMVPRSCVSKWCLSMSTASTLK